MTDYPFPTAKITVKIHPDRMVVILKLCKKYLDNTSFVCHAADSAYMLDKIETDELHAFKDFIDKRIEWNYTVGTWLKRHIGFIPCDREMLVYRHAWIDNMIEEFST